MTQKRIDLAHRVLLGAIISLIALGGGVRAMNAGLACPDWPLCFGDFIPDFHVEVYFEFIHRALAGIISLVLVSLNILVLRSPQHSPVTKRICWLSFGVLLGQVVLGALTVLWLLKSWVVTAHLTMGSMLLLCQAWIAWQVSDVAQLNGRGRLPSPFASNDRVVKASARAALVMIFAQVMLGGVVSSNYAGLACADFPLCQGQWLPTLSGLVGIQVIHRLGAYATFMIVANLVIQIFMRLPEAPLIKTYASWLAGLVLAQMGLGIANVWLGTPPLITVLHLVGAMALLLTALRINFILRNPVVAMDVRAVSHRFPQAFSPTSQLAETH